MSKKLEKINQQELLKASAMNIVRMLLVNTKQNRATMNLDLSHKGEKLGDYKITIEKINHE